MSVQTVQVFTSYKGMFQVADGGPVVVFDAMWPAGMWRQGFEKLFSGVDWESVDSPVHFVELVGHTADNKAYWLIGSYNDPAPKGSHTERIKEIVTLGGPGEKTVSEILARHIDLSNRLNVLAGATTSLGAAAEAAPEPVMDYDDFPAVLVI